MCCVCACVCVVCVCVCLCVHVRVCVLCVCVCLCVHVCVCCVHKSVCRRICIAKWQAEIAEAPAGSESGGRLVWYRQIKNDPSSEIYLTTMNSLGGRKVRMGLQADCLPLAVEVGRYTLECPTDKGCEGGVIVGKWRIRVTF